MNRTFFTIAGLLAASCTVHALDIYVSPVGNDSQTGTKTQPVASITAARDLLRDSGKLGTEPCEVILGAGVYRLSEPVTFTPADSGSEAYPVTYRAVDGADVVFTGRTNDYQRVGAVAGWHLSHAGRRDGCD